MKIITLPFGWSNAVVYKFVPNDSSVMFMMHKVTGANLDLARLFFDWYIFTSSVGWPKPRATDIFLLGHTLPYTFS